MKPTVTSILQELGFERLEASIADLSMLAYSMTELAGSGDVGRPAFEAFPSYIPRISAVAKPKGNILVFDIGGTTVKAAIRHLHGETQAWHLLFETEHAVFNSGPRPGTKLIEIFFAGAAKRCVSELKKLAIAPDSIEGCGLVWSNAMENFKHPELGITARVAGRSRYMKGEWFITDLQDGDDLAQYFVRALAKEGLPTKRLIIGNDTPLTMAAYPGADSGVVAATGLNGTIVKRVSELRAFKIHDLPPETEIICNGEIGGRFLINRPLRTEADYIGSNTEATTIEHLIAGKFVPKLFAHYIKHLAARGVKELSDVAGLLTTKGERAYEEFGMKDVGYVFTKTDEFLDNRKNPKIYSPAAVEALGQLAQRLIRRSAKLAAVVCYATICNQFERKNSFKVALDSRLAREIPLFKDELHTQFAALIPDGVSAELVMLKRIVVDNGKISIPMQGAASAVDGF